MASNLSRKRVAGSPVIPDRLYFKIGDVARICAVEPYVLRFWETQFPQLKPNKSGTGQRLYRRREVELALEIKRLVHGEGYTIIGARQALETVEAVGREALTEMRRMVDVLRQDGEATGLAPPPGLSVVPHLIEVFREAGLPVVLVVEGEPPCSSLRCSPLVRTTPHPPGPSGLPLQAPSV